MLWFLLKEKHTTTHQQPTFTNHWCIIEATLPVTSDCELHYSTLLELYVQIAL